MKFAKEFTIGNKEYKAEFDKGYQDKTVYTLFKKEKLGMKTLGWMWIKVPCFTNAEERRFPKKAGMYCENIIQNLT